MNFWGIGKPNGLQYSYVRSSLISFGEKHGKGLVDGFFALVRTWIKEYMLSTSARIVEVDDLLSVLVEGAARSEQRDEGGPRYVVEKVEPAKPLTSQRVEHVRFQVQKTYCLSIRARGSGQRDPPHWRNHVFSDLVSAPAEGHIVKLVTMPEDDEIGAGGIVASVGGLQQSRSWEPEVP